MLVWELLKLISRQKLWSLFIKMGVLLIWSVQILVFLICFDIISLNHCGTHKRINNQPQPNRLIIITIILSAQLIQWAFSTPYWRQSPSVRFSTFFLIKSTFQLHTHRWFESNNNSQQQIIMAASVRTPLQTVHESVPSEQVSSLVHFVLVLWFAKFSRLFATVVVLFRPITLLLQTHTHTHTRTAGVHNRLLLWWWVVVREEQQNNSAFSLSLSPLKVSLTYSLAHTLNRFSSLYFEVTICACLVCMFVSYLLSIACRCRFQLGTHTL